MRAGRARLKIQVASVNCAYSWTDLLQRRLRLTGITLDQPQIVLTKQPTAPMPATGEAPVTASTPSGPITTQASSGGTSMPFQFVLDRAKVSNGSVSVPDASGTPMVDLQGVDAQADTSGYYEGKDVTGTLRIADATASNLHVTNFSTPFTYQSNGAIQAKPFDASAFGGNIAGDYQTDSPGPSVLDLNAQGTAMSRNSRRRRSPVRRPS